MEKSIVTLQDVRDALSDRRLTKVAEETGLKYQTVMEVANGKRENPTYETFMALVNYLKK